MKTRIIVVSASCFCFCSCAPLFNKRVYDVQVTSNEPEASVILRDSLYSLPAMIPLTRSKSDLEITLVYDDTTELEYQVLSAPDPVFLYANLGAIIGAPIFYSIDFISQKRFTYGKSIRLLSGDTNRVILPPTRELWSNYFKSKFYSEKGELNYTASIPYLNIYNLRPQGIGLRANTGFWGVSMGIEYYYKKNKYLSSRIFAAGDSDQPIFFLPFTRSDEFEDLSTVYLEITDNFKFGGLHIGYGINYALNYWYYENRQDETNLISESQTSGSFGASLNT